jgi:Trk K+ transport system NAD-binding subunit
VTLAGLTAGPIGNLLGVRLRKRDTVAILSAQSLGLELAEELRRGGVPVVLVDSNPTSVRRAEEAGFAVVYGDALQESMMQRARFGFVRTVVALTANKTLNGVFVARARERFGVPNGLVATSDSARGLVAEQVEQGRSKIVFDGPHDVERWDVRGRRGDVRVEHFAYAPNDASKKKMEPSSSGRSNERFVILAVERNREVFVMDADWAFRPGDQIAVVIHTPEYEDAIRELATRGFTPFVGADSQATSETSSGTKRHVDITDRADTAESAEIAGRKA